MSEAATESKEMAEQVAEIVEAHEEKQNKAKRLGALWISILALFLAVNSLGAENTTKEMLTSVIQASDTFSFYQAKSIKQHSFHLMKDELLITLKAHPEWPENLRAEIMGKIDNYSQAESRYESDPQTGEGKKELMEKAKHFQEEFHHAAERDPYHDYAGVMLQIAIVLASAGLTLGMRTLVRLSGLFGGMGMALAIDAYTLLVHIPFF
jgi:hypothetical protein